MLKRIISGAIASTMSAALLAGCGGGGGSQAVPSTPGKGGTSAVSYKITIPGSTATAKNGKRLPLYVSRSTKGIEFEYQATGSAALYTGAPVKTNVTGASVGVGQPGCDASAAANGSYNCTIYVPAAPVGYNDFRVTLWDTAPTGTNCGVLPGTCTFAAGAKALAINVFTNQVVLAGITNTFSYTLLPVVDSVYVQLPAGIVDGAVSNMTGYVVEKDAAGNIILGSDNFVDANFNTITVGLNIANDLGAGGCNTYNAATQCSLYFGTAAANPSFTSAGAGGNTFTLNYDGAQQFPTSGATQPSVTISITGGSAAVQSSLLQVTKSTNGVTVPGQPQVVSVLTYGAAPSYETLGSDQAVWMSTGASISRAMATALSGATSAGANSFTVTSTAGFAAGQIALIGKGTAQEALTVLSVTNSTTFTTTANAANAHAASDPVTASITRGAAQGVLGTPLAIAGGSEGYIWYVDSTANKLGRFAPASSGNVAVTETPVLAGAILNAGLAQGPDGNAWFADTGNNTLNMADPNTWTSATWVNGAAGNVHTLPGSATPGAVASGPKLSSPTGMSTCVLGVAAGPAYSVNCWNIAAQTFSSQALGAQGYSLVTGPDNKLYVGELGQIQVFGSAAGSLTAVSATYPLANAANTVKSMAVSADGNIWFVENGAGAPTFGSLDIQAATPVLSEFSASTGICTAAGTPAGCSGAATPFALILGPAPANKLYFTDSGANKALDSITP